MTGKVFLAKFSFEARYVIHMRSEITGSYPLIITGDAEKNNAAFYYMQKKAKSGKLVHKQHKYLLNITIPKDHYASLKKHFSSKGDEDGVPQNFYIDIPLKDIREGFKQVNPKFQTQITFKNAVPNAGEKTSSQFLKNKNLVKLDFTKCKWGRDEKDNVFWMHAKTDLKAQVIQRKGQKIAFRGTVENIELAFISK